MIKTNSKNILLYKISTDDLLGSLKSINPIHSIEQLENNNEYTHLLIEKTDMSQILKKLSEDISNNKFENLENYTREINKNICQFILLKKKNLVVLSCSDIREWTILINNDTCKLVEYDFVNDVLLHKLRLNKLTDIFEIEIDTIDETYNSLLFKGDNLELSSKFKSLLESKIQIIRLTCKIMDITLTFKYPNKIELPYNIKIAKLMSILNEVLLQLEQGGIINV